MNDVIFAIFQHAFTEILPRLKVVPVKLLTISSDIDAQLLRTVFQGQADSYYTPCHGAYRLLHHDRCDGISAHRPAAELGYMQAEKAHNTTPAGNKHIISPSSCQERSLIIISLVGSPDDSVDLLHIKRDASAYHSRHDNATISRLPYIHFLHRARPRRWQKPPAHIISRPRAFIYARYICAAQRCAVC